MNLLIVVCEVSPVWALLTRPGRAKTMALLLFAGLLFPVHKAGSQDTANIPNPVLPGVADAGVLHYNGHYYIGGVRTNGGFYRSSDLVNWDGPFHVFSMDNDWTEGASAHDSQIHASDIIYLNGVFHHYWSVNYWGSDQQVVHIGHATAPQVLGPYREPVRETWLANRIDAHLFRDKDGKLYLYMVKFTDGNTIWARPMKDPATFAGPPHYLFASLPGTWETRDNRVAEGPWVIRYRNQYYMMYNANHTSTRWGNYALGVAQADGPLEFNNGNKYPYPVLQSNQENLEERYPDLLSAGSFNYTMDAPEENWTAPGFDDAGWAKGKPGFGGTVVENSTVRQVKTAWNADRTEPGRIWLRKSFSFDTESNGNLSLRMHHDGATQVYLNGTPIYNREGRQYQHWNFDENATSALKEGENILAIESRTGEGGAAFLDVSLFDMKADKAGDILFSPGQPNIVRGPNGFEWWLVYMANKNADQRGQYINRIHFLDKKLTVDGITAGNSPGYHPLPAPPTFGDLFSESGGETAWTQRWTQLSGNWKQGTDELLMTGSGPAAVQPRSRPALHYRFEAGVKMSDAAGTTDPSGNRGNETVPGDEADRPNGRAGIYAWRQDENNWMRIVLDRQRGQWTCELRRNGTDTTFSHPLPDDFNYEAYHQLTIYKNAGDFRLYIDRLPAPGDPLIKFGSRNGEIPGEGLPGLYAEVPTTFDGIAYTIGWDEFDNEITGWMPHGSENSSTATAAAAKWQISAGGIGPVIKAGNAGPGHAVEYAVFKGDLMKKYEFSLQITFGSGGENPDKGFGQPQAAGGSDKGSVQTADAAIEAGTAGIYPVYVDRDNYLKAEFRYGARELVISGETDGRPIKTQRLPLATLLPVYADMKYTDRFEKHFTFDAPTWINTLRFSKTPHQRPDTLIEDVYRKMDIYYQTCGKWHHLDQYRESDASHPGFDKISFSPVKASAVKLVNKQADDHHFYAYKLWAGELYRDAYNLRISKLDDTVIFWVNGKELARVGANFPPSSVGLTATGSAVRFNGITCFSLDGLQR